MAVKGRTSKSNRQLKKQLQRSTTEQRQATSQRSTVAIEHIRRIVDILKPWELSRTQKYRTYQSMLRDDAVWSSWESRTRLVQEAQANGKFKYDTNNKVSVAVVEYLRHCMAAMPLQTPRSIAGTCEEYIFNGIAPFEVVTQAGTGDWEGYHVLNKLSYINPITLDPVRPFKTIGGGDTITEWYQLTQSFVNSGGNIKQLPTRGLSAQGNVVIDARKVVTCSYSVSPSNPIGMSAFDAAYNPWREKGLINDFLIMGVQKDMAGIPILEVPQALLDAAAESGSDAYYTVEALKSQMSNLHAGDQSFMIMPSDTQSDTGQGQKMYNITFKGIDGGGKVFDLEGLIDQRNKAIHKVLGGSNLSNAESGAASYNSLEGASNLQQHYVKADCRCIDEMWNKQVFPLLMRLNQWDVAPEDMPKWCHGEASPLSLDETGKFINRTARLLPAVPEVVNKILEYIDIPYRVAENATPEEIRELMFEFSEPSKVGTGNGSSGTGDSQQGGAASDVNSENAA